MNSFLTRRDFLAVAGLSVASVMANKVTFAKKDKVNFLFILTDDQRYDAFGFMGNPSYLKTPNMDRLRHEGAWMKNAFCTTSLCSPSRASFLTGTYPHRHGIMANDMGG